MSESNPETVMQFATFFDCSYLYGERSLMDELQTFLHGELAQPIDRFLLRWFRNDGQKKDAYFFCCGNQKERSVAR